MRATRATGLWSGLIMILVVAGSDSPATGRPGEGAPLAPLLLPAPRVLVEAGRAVELAGQLIWTAPDRIHLLGIVPFNLLAIAPRTGLVDWLASEGPGPWELEGPLALLSAGETVDEVLVHQPGRLRTIVFSALEPPRLIRHRSPITGSAGGWWLGPVHRDPTAGAPARVELRPKASTRVVWFSETGGDQEERISAQYLTRLLRGPGDQLWRVVLGMHGRADLIEPLTGGSRRIEVDPNEGAWIEASADADGVLHLITSGGRGSLGRRILRFAPHSLEVVEGDRDWNTGAVSPDGSEWVAVDAATGAVLLYDLDRATRGRSNR
jgi:hypothetical protein